MRWQMDGLISGGIKTGGALKWDFAIPWLLSRNGEEEALLFSGGE